jgi:hypothetical protein
MEMTCLIQNNILLQVTGITTGRAAALLPLFLGLISIIIGWIILAHSQGRTGYERVGAITALALALIDIILSGVHLIRTSDSSIGTGSGRLGAIVALVIGVIGIILSSRALVRSRQNGTISSKEKSSS